MSCRQRFRLHASPDGARGLGAPCVAVRPGHAGSSLPTLPSSEGRREERTGGANPNAPSDRPWRLGRPLGRGRHQTELEIALRRLVGPVEPVSGTVMGCRRPPPSGTASNEARSRGTSEPFRDGLDWVRGATRGRVYARVREGAFVFPVPGVPAEPALGAPEPDAEPWFRHPPCPILTRCGAACLSAISSGRTRRDRAMRGRPPVGGAGTEGHRPVPGASSTSW